MIIIVYYFAIAIAKRFLPNN